MRKSFTTLLTLLLLPLLALAQGVSVPKNIYFADIHLKISDGAQAEIQKKVDALHRNQSYFKIKVDLADAYFPVIERVFKEEGVPDDFKYLALQESGLIGDAVSTSNAVGYWQFKREAAMDFNLRMDKAVDERRHIIEASRGAALYFKRSNNYYNNWFNSLLSYYLGYTGAKAYTKASDNGARKMDIEANAHPYVITFLAHKVAYDSFVGKANPPAVSLRELRANPGQSLSEIALATKTDYAELEKYNKWLLGSSIPSDKDYYVMIPVRNGNPGNFTASVAETTPLPTRQSATKRGAATMVERNNLNALVAREGDTKDKLALQAGLSTRQFLRYNDMYSFDKVVPGTAYYIEKKHASANTEYHVVQPGETMQMISQHYGVRLTWLLFKNRMQRNEVPVPGRVLWLQKRRPAGSPEVREISKQGTPVAEKQTYKPATQNPEPKQENMLTRFVNSLKGGTQNEAKAAPAATTPAKTAAPDNTEEEEEEVVESVIYNEPDAEPVATTPRNAGLYPGSGKPAAAKASATTPAISVNTQATKPEPATAKVPAQVKTAPAEANTLPAAKPQATEGQTTHVVKQGETLYSISRMYAVTVNDLTRWNDLGDAPLKMGQELLIAEPLMQPETSPFTDTDEDDAEDVPATMLSTSTAYHTVIAGETLYSISKKYNVSLEQLRQWNNLPDNSLKLGQELRVKAPAKAANTLVPASAAPAANSSANSYHVVAGGESMYQISRKYGVTIKDIMEWNNKSDFSVSVGEKLLIKKK
ncbi:LysM peptidoglycan-binding domain-containing protein [Pontibacter oryzae]|uniref:LysM peptidoglycan-binding domain-containing protein n=1 Tax=Pontibacter oryzae TaxID=2304593 RepID=A0A399S0X8_9BACT|nr:LysM peptidoglycan-binding domain-containing protein [Pontibacter oryzae]RIJ36921.1 LysM peptidoglycan-binding domain-containing protein [Pontibacter oryzae]